MLSLTRPWRALGKRLVAGAASGARFNRSHERPPGAVGTRRGARAGRRSLNPLRHVDPFGTVLLPLLPWSAGAPVFGYAKPVPVNPLHYRDLRHGQLATGLLWGVPALFQVDPIGAYFRHTADPIFNLLVPR